MRTNIIIDDSLMQEAKKASGARTKKEVVERGLKMLISISGQKTLLKHKGKYHISIDLNQSRKART